VALKKKAEPEKPARVGIRGHAPLCMCLTCRVIRMEQADPYGRKKAVPPARPDRTGAVPSRKVKRR
jgi:hypothetical protein